MNKLLVAIGILISCFSFGQTEHKILESEWNAIYENTKDFPEETELAIAFINNDQVTYHGIKRVKDTIVYANNSKNVFEIGSITKVFTSTLLSNFVLQKKINLNDPIQDYFDFPLKSKNIKVLELANHTSGLPRLPTNLNLSAVNPFNPYSKYGESDLKSYLSDIMEVNNDTDKNYEYSNLGTGILGYLLETQSKSTYESLLEKYITTKYKMTSTTTDIEKVKSQLVVGRDGSGNVTQNWDLNALVAAGGILSNVEDLSKFVIAQFNPKNKELELTRESTFDIPKYGMKVGLAWNIVQPEPNVSWHMHNGGTGGYSSILAMDVEKKTGIVILSNVSSFHMNARNIDQLCMFLMKNQYTKL